MAAQQRCERVSREPQPKLLWAAGVTELHPENERTFADPASAFTAAADGNCLRDPAVTMAGVQLLFQAILNDRAAALEGKLPDGVLLPRILAQVDCLADVVTGQTPGYVSMPDWHLHRLAVFLRQQLNIAEDDDLMAVSLRYRADLHALVALGRLGPSAGPGPKARRPA